MQRRNWKVLGEERKEKGSRKRLWKGIQERFSGVHDLTKMSQ